MPYLIRTLRRDIRGGTTQETIVAGRRLLAQVGRPSESSTRTHLPAGKAICRESPIDQGRDLPMPGTGPLDTWPPPSPYLITFSLAPERSYEAGSSTDLPSVKASVIDTTQSRS